MPSRTLFIANRGFTFSTPPETFRLPQAYDPFFVEGMCSFTEGSYVLQPFLTPEKNAAILWSGPTWRMIQEKQGAYRIDLRILDTEDWIPASRLSRDFSTGELVALVGRNPAPSPWMLNYPVDQIIFINRLPRCGAVLLHAAGVLYENKVYLFCGRSDIGKTTLARLWRDAGATLLNDDRMLVWMDQGRVLASPSPWHGEDPEINLHTAPVEGIYHLQQRSENNLERLSSSQALSALTATAVLPFYLRESLDPGLDALQKIAETADTYRLGFTPYPDVIHFILANRISGP